MTTTSSYPVLVNADRASDPRIPLWLRVTLVAHTRAYNGTALLDRGELRHHVDPTGCTTANACSEAVRQAIRRGLLAEGSNPRQLVLAPAPRRYIA